MNESAISNGHRTDSDIDVALTERLARPQQLIDMERAVATHRAKPTRLGRFHDVVITVSSCSAIFICGTVVGTVWAR